ncbi:hypothetical protein [Enterococcus spodopteracolus]|uniref:hypothetical protein n=1 Tax=Enterococcus spodopteracolus TaxID=3034501 RepID=UPI0026490FFE|nr:hypothetical protein [Enterococcus spodopteracolus]MDO7880367.1 hypothetical protein [Enterococcus mundtii]
MNKQLSFLNFSTNLEDYLKNENVTISKKLSKSINSKGFRMLMYKGKRLCYIELKEFDEFIGLSIREPSDWQGVYIPCSPYDVDKIINQAVKKFIKEISNSEKEKQK